MTLNSPELSRPGLLRRQKVFLALIIVVALAIISSFFLSANQFRSSVVGMIDSSTYQAIYLDTGEIYFGKVVEANDEIITLADVFYFLDETKTKLVKRGKEAHSLSDAFSINNDHVLATENLDTDSQVVKAIRKYFENKN